MQPFVAAAIQFAAKPMDVERNMRTARSWIERCVETSGASLVVLPESCSTGFTPKGSVTDLWDAVDTLPGTLCDEAISWAKKWDITLCFPTYERGAKRGQVFNSAALVSPSGLLGVYRKTHPFPSERLEAGGWTTPGNTPFCVDTPLGKVGIVICYDGDFPELARVTALQGAEVICRPSAFLRTFDQWELTNRARAYDNHVYWLATNLVGEDASGANFFGGSMIVHPSGQKMAQAGGGEGFAWATLDPDPIRTISPGHSTLQRFDHIQDRNLGSYQGILEEGKSAFEPSQRIPFRRD